jgi:hypothetical protein
MVLLHSSLVTPCVVWCPHCWSHYPTSATPPGLALTWFGLYPLRSPLLGVSRLLSFPDGTEMFQFPSFPPPTLCIQAGVTLHDECRVSPFGHLRIEAQSTAPRSFSQSLTSFIGSWRQGIHRWLFVAWNSLRSFFRTLFVLARDELGREQDARACSAVLKVRRDACGTLEALDAAASE